MINSISGDMSVAAPKLATADNVMREANGAINNWNLKNLGWRGFEKLDWVENITNKYPEASNIAHTCSAHTPGYVDQVVDLFSTVSDKQDRKDLHNFFVGKLGLEELSCRNSGAAGGLCDKKRAFIDICQVTPGLAKQ